MKEFIIGALFMLAGMLEIFDVINYKELDLTDVVSAMFMITGYLLIILGTIKDRL